MSTEMSLNRRSGRVIWPDITTEGREGEREREREKLKRKMD